MSDVGYESLRREAIGHLEAMAGGPWTDFNAHDPGITILEQVCYALSDLVYRAGHDPRDLLSSGGRRPGDHLPPPDRILTCGAVTGNDLRRVAIDVAGVRNASIEADERARVLVRHRGDPERWEIYALKEGTFSHHRESDPRYRPVTIRGVHRVELELAPPDEVGDGPPAGAGTVVRDAVDALRRHRPLGTDLDIRPLGVEKITIGVRIEVGVYADADGVRDRVLDALADHLSPTPQFRRHRDAIDRGVPADQVYDGPLLSRGYLAADALRQLDRKREVHTSDLLRVIMAVPGVSAVLGIDLRAPSAGGGTADSTESVDPWLLAVPAGAVPRLDRSGSVVEVVRAQLPVSLADPGVGPATAGPTRPSAPETSRAPSPGGRDRHVGRYLPVQHQLPRTYGVGAAGLPASASAERKAEAAQLKAYLLLFDQLLANEFAQLAALPLLFAPEGPAPTYFSQPVDHPELGLDAVVSAAGRDPTGLQTMVDGAVGERATGDRRHRFADHLLARYAEHVWADGRADDALLQRKLDLLLAYPRLSAARGTGAGFGPAGGDGGWRSGLQERLAIELGLTGEETALVVEHVLLRPIDQDVAPRTIPDRQRNPVLEAGTSDPYSFQLSVVLPEAARSADPRLGARAERLVGELTPAHLVPSIRWLGAEEAGAVTTAHRQWAEALGRYQEEVDDQSDPGHHLPLRAARDRLIELLGIGSTHPLLDLPVTAPAKSPYGAPAKVIVGYSQIGVRYQLLHRDAPAADPVEGSGGDLVLVTPPIDGDVTFDISAEKSTPSAAARSHRLYTTVTIEVGLDTGLAASVVDADLLDPATVGQRQDAPRIVDYGSAVTVAIEGAQEGVTYRLVALSGGSGGAGATVLSGDTDGLGHDITIELRSHPLTGDTDLRVLAVQDDEQALLDVTLPVKVRADPDLAVAAEPVVVPHGGTTSITVAAAEAGVVYRAYARPLADHHLARPVGGGDQLMALDPDVGVMSPVADDQAVRISDDLAAVRPPRSNPWTTPAWLHEVASPAAAPAAGGDVTIELDGVDADQLLVIRADKVHHWLGPDGSERSATSSVELLLAGIVVVEPDPGVPLTLWVPMGPDGPLGRVELAGGTPGVFYQLQRSQTGDELGGPAYFHQLLEVGASTAKGIDRLGVEVDLVVSRPAADRQAGPGTGSPAGVLIDAELPLDRVIRVRATRATTGASTLLTGTVTLRSMPTIRLSPAVVERGAPVEVEILLSRKAERYQVLLDGTPLGPAQDGSGAKLVVATPPLDADADIEVIVTQPGSDGLALTRSVHLAVAVSPA